MKRAPLRWWDFPAAALLLLALLVSASRLIAARWDPALNAAVTLTILGTALGLALGQSRFGRRAVLRLAAGYSLIFVPWVLGETFYDGMGWLDRLASLAERTVVSLILLFQKQPVEDTFLFVLMVSAAYWCIAMAAGAALTRRADFVLAVLPAGVGLFLAQLADGGYKYGSYYVAAYLFLMLALLGRLTYLRKQDAWRRQNVAIPGDAGRELSNAILLGAAILVLAAYLAPTSTQSFASTRRLWQEFRQSWESSLDDLENIVAGLESTHTGTRVGFETDSLRLGLRAAAGDNPLFTIRIPFAEMQPLYWRVRSYDFYENGEWKTTLTDSQPLAPAQPPLPLADAPSQPAGEFLFQIHQDGISLLPAPPRAVWVSRPVEIVFQPAAPDRLDPILFWIDPPLLLGERYQVQAIPATPAIAQLQAAGSEYPAWVTDAYLQLPQEFPQRLRDLAAELTADAPTAYDKAEAITQYLREEITYATAVPAAPQGRETLEWFLLEHKQGYCNYSASAEVLLLRSLGVPARLAVGYAAGEPLSGAANTRLVRERDAHAWPEVYFPGIGWVEFEPTTSQPEIARPLQPPSAAMQPSPAGADETTLLPPLQSRPGMKREREFEVLPPALQPKGRSSAWTYLLPAALAALTAGGLYWRSRRRRHAPPLPLPVRLKNWLERRAVTPPRWLMRWARASMRTPLERAFGVVHRSLRRLGAPSDPTRTPAQAAAALTGLLPGAAAEIRLLLEEYQSALFAAPRRKAPALRRLGAASRRIAVQAHLEALRRFFA